MDKGISKNQTLKLEPRIIPIINEAKSIRAVIIRGSLKKKEFITYAQALAKEGYLLHPEHIIFRDGDEILTLRANCNLQKTGIRDVRITTLNSLQGASKLHAVFRELLSNDAKVNTVMLSQKAFTKGAADAAVVLYPLLDDLAQMIGTKVKIATFHESLAALGKNSAVLIKDEGGLCAAKNLYDLQAVAMVLEKGAQAQIESFFLGGAKRINFFEALLMRFIFLKKYSKVAESK